jgi:phosphoribosyl 1,2-cyclic phosphodiesterase
VLTASRAPALRVRSWGTRGSLPCPGAGTVHYGGNTSCVEVVDGSGVRIVFDAGSGIRPLGESIARTSQPAEVELFLTHFHWDHIQGLPFFRPLYDEAASVRIHGPRQGELDVQALVAGQMRDVYFPVPFGALTATLHFHDLDEVPVELGSAVISAHRMRHATNAWGFRIDAGGRSVAYLPDNELVGGSHAAATGWYDSLCDFIGGVDLLLHDAMFTESEYTRYEGWGHSTATQAVRLAEQAGVRRLQLFHHSPDRTDADLARLLESLQQELAHRGSTLVLEAAAEGEEIMLHGAQ